MSFRGSRLTIGLLTGLVVVLLLGSGAAIAISQHDRPGEVGVASGVPGSTSVAARGPSTTIAAPTKTGAPTTVGGPTTTGVLTTPGAPTGPGTHTTAPDGPSNNLTVQMSPDVQRSARSTDVQQLLQGYFDAINQHSYSGWAQTVTDKMANSQNSSQWLDAYATTVDSSIWMRSISDDPFTVGVHFTSQQDPDLAPADLPVGCIDWTVTYRIESEGARLVVGSTMPDSVKMVKC